MTPTLKSCHKEQVLSWCSEPGRAAEAQDALGRRFQVVSGKGGVGRSTVAAALALRSAEAGARTLLLDVDGAGGSAAFFGGPPVFDHPKLIRQRLWLCSMTPQGAMSEYALMILKVRALYSLVFERRMVQQLLGSIPSLAEFTMIGKAWFHATERLPDGTPRFERVILDAPATGHAVTFLSVARVVAEVVPAGVMQEAARRMAELVESDQDACLHVVALPEELPVTEGLELAQASRARIGMTLGLGVMNRLLPPLCDGPQDALRDALERDRELFPYARVLAARMRREAEQRAQLGRFTAGLGRPWVALPYAPLPGAELVARAAEQLDQLSAPQEARAS